MITVAIEIIRASWQVFYESAVYMLLGFFIAGILYVFIKPETIGRYLGGGKVRSVFLAALAGIPIPLCSCGVLPAAAGLKRQGADNGATLSFLISTPESGIDSIPLTFALMDPIIALIRPVAAFITAVVTGLFENFSTRRNNSSENFSQLSCSDSSDCGCNSTVVNPGKPMEKPFAARIVSGLKYAFVDLLGDIGKWFIVGILMAGMITCMIPDALFESYLTNNFIAILVMLIAGIPMYVCATASTPIAAALVLKGLNPGAALVFLLAGPATNVASISVVSGLLGKRSLMIYLGSIAICSVILGIFTDMLYYSMGISATAVAGQAADIIPHFIQMGSAVILGVLLLFGLCQGYSRGRTFFLGIRRKLNAI
ncbi:MAG TPA: SO_0444 family Cu/Zn efflux transporter [Desulfobacterales bacterium]|nr:SO_0444 family Cu/Zn efflux transporter [Desulfobacterales bacterium]